MVGGGAEALRGGGGSGVTTTPCSGSARQPAAAETHSSSTLRRRHVRLSDYLRFYSGRLAIGRTTRRIGWGPTQTPSPPRLAEPRHSPQTLPARSGVRRGERCQRQHPYGNRECSIIVDGLPGSRRIRSMAMISIISLSSSLKVSSKWMIPDTTPCNRTPTSPPLSKLMTSVFRFSAPRWGALLSHLRGKSSRSLRHRVQQTPRCGRVRPSTGSPTPEGAVEQRLPVAGPCGD